MELKQTLAAVLSGALICAALPTDADARLKPKKPYKVQWAEHGNRIDTSSVCGNFARSSLEFRECRSYAVEVFKRKCRKYKRRYEQAGYTAKRRERRKMMKFCGAYRQFSP